MNTYHIQAKDMVYNRTVSLTTMLDCMHPDCTGQGMGNCYERVGYEGGYIRNMFELRAKIVAGEEILRCLRCGRTSRNEWWK